MTKITVASTAGFCFGVDRAAKVVYDFIEKGEKACTLGPLIHNPDFVSELEEKGVHAIDTAQQAQPGETLIIRTHGIQKEIQLDIVHRGIPYFDATCPFVKKIHGIVREESEKGNTILIAGDANHPEVLGIKSYCSGECYVFANEDELDRLLTSMPDIRNNPITVVSQTTFSEKELKKCSKKLKIVCTNAKIFDTICSATALRQQEAVSLAGKSDMMIVIGGRNSSNTAKLYSLCAEICPTHLIENAAELASVNFSGVRSIGLTAGASTPVRTIKEVLKTMSENINDNEIVTSAAESEGQTDSAEEAINTDIPYTAEPEIAPEDMTFEQALEESLKSMNSDQKVVGTVMHVAPNEIQVDIGRKQTGYIPLDEYSADPNADPMKELKEGDELNLIIMKTNDAEGTVMLSKRRFDAIKYWEQIVEASKEGTILEGVVVEVISKGLIVFCNGIRIFIPASLSTVPRAGRLEDMLDKTVNFRIVDVDKRRRRAVGSIKDAAKDIRKANQAKFWEEVEEGKKYVGTVKSLTDFGAFVDLGGVDGMVHRTELSWKRIKHPSEVVSVGDTIEVFVKAIDREKKKISLGYKKIEDSPWEILKRDYPVGTVCDVKIVSLTTFGAFAEIFPQMEGLIHISQISHDRIAKPQDVLSIGDTVKVKITEIDTEKKRISLSMKALIEQEAPTEEEVVEDDAPVAISIDDLLAAAENKGE